MDISFEVPEFLRGGSALSASAAGSAFGDVGAAAAGEGAAAASAVEAAADGALGFVVSSVVGVGAGAADEDAAALLGPKLNPPGGGFSNSSFDAFAGAWAGAGA